MEDKVNFRSRNSLKVDVAEVANGKADITEKYKKIPEEQLNGTTDANQNQSINKDSQTLNQDGSAVTMVQDESIVNDGADEQMLGVEDNEKLADKREEVKFIKGDHKNGDAKIDISVVNAKAFTGMSKEELMKYANDPFWVRLRWIFFIAFWGIWVGMLVGAIFIIVDAPKCAAPEPLPWYKKGPLAKASLFQPDASDVVEVKRLHASGVIYELPADLTYSVKEPEVEIQIKNIVDQYKVDNNVYVIFDLTPNFAGKDSEMMKNALTDPVKRSAFIWSEKAEIPNNWVSTMNETAWQKLENGNYVLSQFGKDRFDLHMNSTIVKKALGDVLRHLIGLGVNGFRFKNTQFFLLSINLEDEQPYKPVTGNDYVQNQYGFWTHTKSTFQDGLGDVLFDYMAVVKNASATAFLSVADDVKRPEVYKTTGGASFGIDIPIYKSCKTVQTQADENALEEQKSAGDLSICDTWVQRNLDDEEDRGDVDPSAYALYVSLLPGVPVISLNADVYRNVSSETFKHIDELRQSQSYMHGDYQVRESGELAVFSRIKSSNPGYLVIMNPTEVLQVTNFTDPQLPAKMTVDFVSSTYKHPEQTNIVNGRTTLLTNEIPVTPGATIILTYVPVK